MSGWRAPAFWQTGGWPARLLAPLGRLYGTVTLARMRRPAGYRPPVPVVAIGNLVLGGAGKTPSAILVARLLEADGRRPVVVSRGYGGRLAGPLRVDPQLHGAGDVGDEPLMMARRGLAVMVSRDRAAGVRAAVAAGADVVVLDDGFQSPAVAKDLSILVVDAEAPVGNGLVFPAGPLRAPVGPQLAAAHLVLAIGEGELPDLLRAVGRPVLAGRLAARESTRFAGRRLLGYAGIGRPAKVAATLRACGADLAGFEAFPDHHVFSEADARRLLHAAGRAGAGLVTTEKDAARLGGRATGPLADLAKASDVLAVDLVVADPGALSAALGRLFGEPPAGGLSPRNPGGA
ncbi:tetraacyldisaccharide 4'-kinase [Prosthecomicrobium sp. N25]|uniref:tetraacyldisaccharide 4'-kinase n=1 Tax=Prosthecomicrobium sp. N25 TaxID=3129254 RepID=UPI0030769F6F